jgi:hypothetical protein
LWLRICLNIYDNISAIIQKSKVIRHQLWQEKKFHFKNINQERNKCYKYFTVNSHIKMNSFACCCCTFFIVIICLLNWGGSEVFWTRIEWITLALKVINKGNTVFKVEFNNKMETVYLNLQFYCLSIRVGFFTILSKLMSPDP